MTDKLTGLPTHNDFPAAIAGLRGRRIEAVLVDIASMIWENDQFGHEHGDTTIRSVAGLLAEAASQRGARAYRFGGEEFLILLPDVAHDEALHLARSIVDQVSALKLEYRRLDHPRDFVAVNAVGACLDPKLLEDASALREYLATKIYEAKVSEGRDYNLVIDVKGAA